MTYLIDHLAGRHWQAAAPQLCRAGFLADFYGVTAGHVRRIALGSCRPSTDVLLRINATHARLFPSEPITLALPDGRRVELGRPTLTITHPATN